MSLTTTIITIVQRDGIFGTETPPPGDNPPVPTGSFDDLPEENPHNLSQAGLISIIVSLFSLVLTGFAGYWFFRMRRRFRHELIIIVILSNAWRALWRFLFPIIEYFQEGMFPTESTFCQVSGFFLSLGVEATDVAIMLIAVHSALSVFSRKATHRQGGLYPYRKWAYAVWVLFPILIASLAFANPDQPGYSAQGSVCYLPTRPYRFVNLTWIPRYVVTVTVLTVYPGIYFYATHKSHQYQREVMGISRLRTYDKGWLARIRSLFKKEKADQQSLQQGQNLMTARERRKFTQAFHLLRTGSDHYGPYSRRHHDIDSSLVLETSGSGDHHPRLPGGGFDFPWNELEALSIPVSTRDRNAADVQNALENVVDKNTIGASTSAAQEFGQGTTGTAEELEAPQTQAETQRRQSGNTTAPYIRPPESALSRRSSWSPSLADSIATSTSLAPSLNSSIYSKTDTQNDVPKLISSSQIIAQEARMRRQLRYLFLYPATYVLLWITPFVAHIIKTTPDYYNDPSFVLNASVIASASIQAAVDCILFSVIEKPWKHIPGSDGSILGSFKCLEIRRRRKQGNMQDPVDVRERLAIQLRDLERVDQRTLVSELNRTRVRPRQSQKGERYWWDGFEDEEDGLGMRKSSARGRRVNWVDGLEGVEDGRGRPRQRRISFPEDLARPEREPQRRRSESYPSDRSRSEVASGDQRRSLSADDWHRESRSEMPILDREGGRTGVLGSGEASHGVRLNDAGDVEEGENLKQELTPPPPRIVERDDHG